jgi:hypothetical protein
MAMRYISLIVGFQFLLLAAADPWRLLPSSQQFPLSDGGVLELGRPIETKIAAGDIHVYVIKLRSGEFLRLELKQQRVILGVTLLGPDGDIVVIDNLEGSTAPQPVLFVANSSGSYELKVSARAAIPFVGKAPVGRYEVKIAELRVAWPEENRRLNRPSPSEIFRKIKLFAQEEVNATRARITGSLPVLYIDREEKTVEYQLGEIKIDKCGLAGHDPYQLPYQKQIHIELIERSFSKQLSGDPFWKKHLRRAEHLIYLSILDIESTPNRNNLRRKLVKRREQIDKEFHELVIAIRHFAKRRGYRARRYTPLDSGCSGCDQAPELWPVRIATEPPSGTVKLLTMLAYRQCNDLKKCGSKRDWPWLTLVQGDAKLGGRYYYLTQWPNGQRVEGIIFVRNAEPLVFRPQ